MKIELKTSMNEGVSGKVKSGVHSRREQAMERHERVSDPLDAMSGKRSCRSYPFSEFSGSDSRFELASYPLRSVRSSRGSAMDKREVKKEREGKREQGSPPLRLSSSTSNIDLPFPLSSLFDRKGDD